MEYTLKKSIFSLLGLLLSFFNVIDGGGWFFELEETSLFGEELRLGNSWVRIEGCEAVLVELRDRC